MGAFGDVVCEYCGERYYEEDTHTCRLSDIWSELESLRAQLAKKERECERLRSAAVLLNVAIDDFLNNRRPDRIEARRLMGEIYINSICYRQKEVHRALENDDG